MEPSNLHVLVEAKTEYTKTLTSILVPRLREGIFSIFQESLTHCRDNNIPNQLLVTFQKYLSSIPRWSDYMVEEEYDRIQRLSKCDYIDDLITAVFVSHTKILTSIRSGTKIKKIDLTIPKPQTFIHKAYIECARLFWKQPYVFILSTKYSEDMEVSKIKQQQNYRECEKIIEEALNETIRRMLPVKSILSTYLGESVNDLMTDNIEDDGLNHDIVKSLVEKELAKHKQEQQEIADAPMDAPGDASADETPAETPAETPTETPADAPGDAPVDKTPDETPTEIPTETPTEILANIVADDLADAPGDAPGETNEITLNLDEFPTIDQSESNVTLNQPIDGEQNEPETAVAPTPATAPTPVSEANEEGDISNIGSLLREVKQEVEKTRNETPTETPETPATPDATETPSNENITFQAGIEDNEGKTERMMAMYDDDEDDDDRQVFSIVDGDESEGTIQIDNVVSLDGESDRNTQDEPQDINLEAEGIPTLSM